MEHVGKVLGNLKREEVTHPRQTITYNNPEDDPAFVDSAEYRLEQLRRRLGVSTLENTFKNFLPQKGTEKALQACQVLASGKANWNMLLIYGGVGNGKTHLLEALVIELSKEGIFCRVMNYSKMMSALRSTMNKDSELSFKEIFERWCQAERLVIDDVGIGGSDSEWSMKMLEDIILARYRDGLFTVLSTNVDISELPERVVSRFKDPQRARMVLNSGEDYRPKKGK